MARQRTTLEEKLHRAARVICGNIAHYRLNDDLEGDEAWQIGQTIFQIKNPSGKISVQALDAVLSGQLTKSQLCDEHFYPRVDSGKFILSTFKDREVNMKELIELIRKFTQTHKVLSEQNMQLKKLNSRNSTHPLKDASWEEQYAHFEIVLVDNVDMRTLRFAKKK